MKTTLIHISDLHLRAGWPEEQGVVLEEFFSDLEKQTNFLNNVYVVFTGDVINEGSDYSVYEYFDEVFEKRFSNIGIDRKNIIFVPGNHDIDREYTKNNFSIFKALQERTLDETAFNNSIYKEQKDLFLGKFLNYLNWQKNYSSFCLNADNFAGSGFNVSENIGIYILNTALLSFGGLPDEKGGRVVDEGSLLVETRNLHEWLQNEKFEFRILAMHHPISCLKGWAREQIESVSKKHFDLLLSGHIHEGTAVKYHDGRSGVLVCIAPPLFTRKSETLGYSLITVDDEADFTSIRYRHWVGDCFVSGTALSKSDDGEVRFHGASSSPQSAQSPVYFAVQKELEISFRKVLSATLLCLRCGSLLILLTMPKDLFPVNKPYYFLLPTGVIIWLIPLLRLLRNLV